MAYPHFFAEFKQERLISALALQVLVYAHLNRKSLSYPPKQTYSFDEVFRRRERRYMEREP